MQHRALFEPRAMQLYVLALVKFCEALTNNFSLWFIQGQEGTEQNKRVREALVQEIRQGLLMFCCPRARSRADAWMFGMRMYG